MILIFVLWNKLYRFCYEIHQFNHWPSYKQQCLFQTQESTLFVHLEWKWLLFLCVYVLINRMICKVKYPTIISVSFSLLDFLDVNSTLTTLSLLKVGRWNKTRYVPPSLSEWLCFLHVLAIKMKRRPFHSNLQWLQAFLLIKSCSSLDIDLNCKSNLEAPKMDL